MNCAGFYQSAASEKVQAQILRTLDSKLPVIDTWAQKKRFSHNYMRLLLSLGGAKAKFLVFDTFINLFCSCVAALRRVAAWAGKARRGTGAAVAANQPAARTRGLNILRTGTGNGGRGARQASRRCPQRHRTPGRGGRRPRSPGRHLRRWPQEHQELPRQCPRGDYTTIKTFYFLT